MSSSAQKLAAWVGICSTVMACIVVAADIRYVTHTVLHQAFVKSRLADVNDALFEINLRETSAGYSTQDAARLARYTRQREELLKQVKSE